MTTEQFTKLIEAIASLVQGRSLFEILRWQLDIADLVAVLLVRPAATVRAIVHEKQRRVDRQLGNQGIAAAPDHLQSIVVAESAIQHLNQGRSPVLTNPSTLVFTTALPRKPGYLISDSPLFWRGYC